MSVAEIDKTALNDVALVLQKAFNDGDPEHIKKAINILTGAVRHLSPAKCVRADRIKIPETFYKFLSTGLGWLDEIFGGGFRRQELIIIGGAPHEGKTHLLSFLSSCYLIEGYTVLHFNGEDLISDIMKIYELALTKDDQLERLYVVDITEAKFDSHSIDAVLADLAEEKIKVDVVVVDHIDIMQGSGEGADWLSVSETTRQLRFLAKKYDIIMLTGSQLNFRSDTSPRGMGRFFRSKVGKASHADVVWMIHEAYDDHLVMELNKARGRKIRFRKSTLNVDYDKMVIKKG